MIQNSNRNESPPIRFNPSTESAKKPIINAEESEIFYGSYNEGISSPIKSIEKDNQIFIDKKHNGNLDSLNIDNESESDIEKINSNYRDSTSPEQFNKDNIKSEKNLTKVNEPTNDEPKSDMVDKNSNSPIKTAPKNYELSEPKSNFDLDYSGQFSENPSPLARELDSSENQNHDEQYMSNKFFIDDTKKSDENNYSDNNINLFALTPDQQSAYRELELRQQLMEFEDDNYYAYNYDMEYDVREKLETLNAQLANEPSPPEPEHRNSRVAFKEELVSLVAPPDEYALSESEPEDVNEKPVDSSFNQIQDNNEVIDPSPPVESNGNSIPPPKVEVTRNESSNFVPESYDYEREIHDPESDPEFKIDKKENSQTKTELNEETKSESESESDISPSQETNIDNSSKKDLEIVVSRGGKFQFLDQNDMVDSSGNIVNPEEEVINQNNKKHQARPISAPATKRNRNDVWLNDPLNSSSNSIKSEKEYRSKGSARSSSKNDVPKVDRELLQRQKDKENKRKQEQREKEESDLKEKRDMNEKCFNSWLQKKNLTLKEETDRRKKEEDEEKKQREKNNDEKKKEDLNKLKEYAKTKELQRRKDEKLRQYRFKEMEEALVVHTESECKKAFKEWMKKKKDDLLMKQKEEKEKARVTRLAMRQCRKSQNLAQAIHQANSFRYLDFYGYP